MSSRGCRETCFEDIVDCLCEIVCIRLRKCGAKGIVQEIHLETEWGMAPVRLETLARIPFPASQQSVRLGRGPPSGHVQGRASTLNSQASAAIHSCIFVPSNVKNALLYFVQLSRTLSFVRLCRRQANECAHLPPHAISVNSSSTICCCGFIHLSSIHVS